MKYYRYDIQSKALVPGRPRGPVRYERLFSKTPIPVLRLIGRLFYRYAG